MDLEKFKNSLIALAGDEKKEEAEKLFQDFDNGFNAMKSNLSEESKSHRLKAKESKNLLAEIGKALNLQEGENLLNSLQSKLKNTSETEEQNGGGMDSKLLEKIESLENQIKAEAMQRGKEKVFSTFDSQINKMVLPESRELVGEFLKSRISFDESGNSSLSIGEESFSNFSEGIGAYLKENPKHQLDTSSEGSGGGNPSNGNLKTINRNDKAAISQNLEKIAAGEVLVK